MSIRDVIDESDFAGSAPDSRIALDLPFVEAEALREWLLKASVAGATCLDEPLVNRVLSRLGQLIDAIRATAQVRSELVEAGLDVAHLTDEQVQDLARRISEAARPGLGS